MSQYEPIRATAKRVNRYDEKALIVEQSEAVGVEAAYAMRLIEQHAMVAGETDGEDSQGRQKLRVQTPEELVARSFAIAELAFTEARRRGWMIAIPPSVAAPEQEKDPAR